MYEQLGSLSVTNKSIADLYKEISLKNTTDISSAEPPTPRQTAHLINYSVSILNYDEMRTDDLDVDSIMRLHNLHAYVK